MANFETNYCMTATPHHQGMMTGSNAGQPGPGIIGGICFMIAIGAGIYLVRHAHGFWGVLWTLVRAVFWPVVVGYWMMSRLMPAGQKEHKVAVPVKTLPLKGK